MASIFQEYYREARLVDRYLTNYSNALDVIIPVYHTNELWRSNLHSIYREVPVRRLLISDGGVIDDSISIAREFPRVEILDHREFKTLGKCVAELIKQVTSEWFIYLHSDVYLPAGWFEAMLKHQREYDWFGCPMNITVLAEYRLQRPERPYAGSQMGRKAAFFPRLENLEDDYVYRQEDFVFKQIVEENGFKEGQVEDTFHYHQVMSRPSKGCALPIKEVRVSYEESQAEQERAAVMQLCGLIKYVQPSSKWLISDFQRHAFLVLDRGYLGLTEVEDFIRKHNPRWGPYFNRRMERRRKLRKFFGAVKHKLLRAMFGEA